MKITLSKQQWEEAGKQTGWIKTASTETIDAELKAKHPIIHALISSMPFYKSALDIVDNIKNNSIPPENAGITSDIIDQAKQIIQSKEKTASNSPKLFDNTIIIKEALTLDARVIAAIILVVLGIALGRNMISDVKDTAASIPSVSQQLERAIGKQ